MKTSNLIAGEYSSRGNSFIQAINPVTKEKMPETFVEATYDEINEACAAAQHAFAIFKHSSGKKRGELLRDIAVGIEELGEELIDRAVAESGLPVGRITGERGRTCGQLRLFASLIEEGSWVNAIIDTALPDRQPPRSDIRQKLVPLGPVAIFGASNFPLAFSTAGGDTASALAAGCPVIIKGHPSHPGTNALVAAVIAKACEKAGLPAGVFSMIQGSSYKISTVLVQHPAIKAVGFTGSYQGGMALVKAASLRDEPIPVFAEMGSINPIVVLPEKLAADIPAMASNIANSVNLGAGQFCTNPGLIITVDDDSTNQLMSELKNAFSNLPSQPMLNESIFNNYETKKSIQLSAEAVETIALQKKSDEWHGKPAIAQVSAANFLDDQSFQEEVFGPFSLVVRCADKAEMLEVINAIGGQLTGSIMGTLNDLEEFQEVIPLLENRVGRLIYNGVPTGVEVCHAMQHGGPFPASSDGRFTSVGTEAIKRFVRPVSYQDCPDHLLPEELQSANPLGIWRKVNGEMSKE